MAYPSKIRFISLLGILAVVAALLVPALPKSIHAQDPTPRSAQKIEAEDAQVWQEGTWNSQSAATASGGSYLYNTSAGMAAEPTLQPTPSAGLGASAPHAYESALVLQFLGTTLEVIYVAGPTLGTLAIEVDGTVLRTVITTDAETRYGQVAKIDYLTDETHTLKVYAQEGGVIAVDAFIIQTGQGGEVAFVEHAADSPLVFCDPSPGIQRINLSNGGFGQSNGPSERPSVSDDKRYIAWDTNANNMIANDTNSHADVFIRDLETCATTRVTVASNGAQANNGSGTPYLSTDGKYLIFDSLATNLVPNDTNNGQDIFGHDVLTGETTRLSVASDGTQANRASARHRMSSDGRFIVFTTAATNLDPADTSTDLDVFLHDRQTGTTSLVPVNISNPRGALLNLSPQISDDGQFVTVTALFSCSPFACSNVYLHDRQTNLTTQLVPATGLFGSSDAAITREGRYVAFHSDSPDVGGGPGPFCNYFLNFQPVSYPCRQIYLYDRTTGQTTRLTSVGPGQWAMSPYIAPGAHYLTYEVKSVNTNFNTSNSNIGFLNRVTGQTTIYADGNGDSFQSMISPDGKIITFTSSSSDLVTGDTNGVMDIFVVAENTTTPPPAAGDKLALFQPSTNTISLVQTLDGNPSPTAITTFAINPPADASTLGQWVMGDWDGDGDKTPGVYASSGAFYYTNAIGASTTWNSVWIGLIGRPPVAGRFNAAVNHDCIGAVDSASYPPYGLAFALYFTCDLTNGTAPPLTFHWLSVILAESAGFSGTHQFAAGDFNSDGVDSIAVRRGEFIAFGNVPPTTLLAEINLAQYWGTPPVTNGTYGMFLVGDFDNGAGDGFGVYYQNGNFYYRNAVDWSPGAHTLQQVGTPLGTAVQATTWR